VGVFLKMVKMLRKCILGFLKANFLGEGSQTQTLQSVHAFSTFHFWRNTGVWGSNRVVTHVKSGEMAVKVMAYIKGN
jgi:hypothetical protein